MTSYDVIQFLNNLQINIKSIKMNTMITLIFTLTILSASCGLLDKLSKSKLAALAIATEDVYRKENNVFLLGGLYNYANSLSKDRLKEEITNLITLGGVKVEEFVETQVNKLTKLTYTFPLKAILSKFTKEQLLTIASQIETHIRSEHMFTGGLHDYAESLNKEELVDAIIKFSTVWGEYRSILVVLASKIDVNHVVSAFKEVSTVFSKTLAYALEKYSRKLSGNENLLGGVHDIIERTEDLELIWKEIENQLYGIVELEESFVTKLLSVEFVEDLLNSNIMTQDEVAEYLEAKSIEDLRELALKTEKHYRIVMNKTLLGGLHDYIERLTSSDLIEYIQSKAKSVPLIATEKFLDN